MIRRVPIRRKRPTLRRGEPSREEKAAARVKCRTRARGCCEVCGKLTPLGFGHLHHEHGKRRFGWMESDQQRHVWLCPACHAWLHSGGKPVAITKAEARAAADLERLTSQPDDAQPQSESQQLPAPL